ncbi:MAG TPA: ABC transporter permease [Thiobacillaceae bacterium]|nr:ABC transporter permease [Thiobacillaceae bacterium]HNA83103.1 ABC transporter permease [Thiobacillaceae bacterium]HNF89040.1 ABC transporter permease [Thiobacillaceae bacterium]HNH89729.1 ABC transporter permease [Thiobacillaceae bacterium]HNI07049.1 ABC transporter permease [Thiobacillaceae bacterium]
MPFEWVLALRFLREGRMQTALIMAGTTVGVAVIIFITTLVNGLQISLASRTLSTQAHITVRAPDDAPTPVLDRTRQAVAAHVEPRVQRLRSIDQWERIYRELPTLAHVVDVSPIATGSGFAFRGSASKSIALMGVIPERYNRIVKVADKLSAGQYRVGPGEALVGIELARDLGAAVGDRIRVLSSENREDVFRITGLFDLGVKDLNRRWVIVPLRSAQTLLDLPGGVTHIDMTVDDIFLAEDVAQRVASQSGLTAESWMAINTQLLTAFKNQNMTTRTVRAFLVLIVALGIASVLVVSVVQKQREIGILRAMGASPRRIMKVFLIQGGIYGASGALLGSFLSTLMVKGASVALLQDDGTPVLSGDIELSYYLTAAAVALFTGLLAAVAPARRAARMDPVEAIRYG